MRHARAGKKLGPRPGDAAEMAYLELVEDEAQSVAAPAPEETRRRLGRRRAWMSPRRPSVIICSAIGLTAFAFVTVVLIRPCSISAPARFE